MHVRSRSLTLSDAVLPRAGLLRDVSLIVGFSLLTVLCARISFYIGPVPHTAQTFAVLLAGALLGSRRGALSMILYLGQGAMGLPVFASGLAGSAVLLGPTGGYLYGFVVAAFVVGLLAERSWDRHIMTAALAMLVGNIIIYAFGLPWLARVLPGVNALSVGLYPFIIGDLVKLAIAAVVLPSGWEVIRRLQR